MTNLLTVLKTMETETTGVKNDVINWVLEDVENYSPQDKLQDLLSYGCKSGQVNHLIYYKDTVKYFEDHESEIMDMLEMHGIVDVESWEGIDELSNIFPQLDDAETRHEEATEEAEEEAREKSEEELSDYYGNEWEEMSEDEQNDAIIEYAINIMMYERNPMELNTQDKNYLAWVIFEYEAVNLENELSEMGAL